MNATLPAEAFANGKLPLIACYYSTDSGATWQAVAQVVQASGVPYCILAGQTVSMRNLQVVFPTNYRFYIVVMW